MDTKGLNQTGKPEGFDRRAFNARLSSLGLAMAVLPVVPTTVRAAGDVTYFTWAGYEVPELHPSYIEQYGGSPETTFFADEQEAFAKLRAGFSPDLAHPCSTSVSRWYDAEIIRPMDPDRLAHWNDLAPAFRDLPGTSVNGQPLFVPNDWGSNSIAYRTDLVDPEYADAMGWRLLMDESLTGRTAMWNSLEAAVAFASIILGIEDTTNVTDQQIEEMKGVLAEQKRHLRTYWASETEAEALMASGEVAASYFWNPPVLRLQDQGIPVAYMHNPVGGVISWVCGLVMTSAGGGDEQAAYDFINAWNSPEAGKFLVEVYGYGHANLRTYDNVDSAILESMGLAGDIDEYLANSTPYRSWEPELLVKYVNMFEEVKTGE